jgi:hypothetical protein
VEEPSLKQRLPLIKGVYLATNNFFQDDLDLFESVRARCYIDGTPPADTSWLSNYMFSFCAVGNQ